MSAFVFPLTKSGICMNCKMWSIVHLSIFLLVGPFVQFKRFSILNAFKNLHMQKRCGNVVFASNL